MLILVSIIYITSVLHLFALSISPRAFRFCSLWEENELGKVHNTLVYQTTKCESCTSQLWHGEVPTCAKTCPNLGLKISHQQLGDSCLARLTMILLQCHFVYWMVAGKKEVQKIQKSWYSRELQYIPVSWGVPPWLVQACKWTLRDLYWWWIHPIDGFDSCACEVCVGRRAGFLGHLLWRQWVVQLKMARWCRNSNEFQKYLLENVSLCVCVCLL